MIKAKYLLLMLALFLSCSASAQMVSIQEQFENELKSKNKDVTSIICNFVQTREVSVLQNAIKKDGTFYFLHPANILLSFKDGDYIKMTKEWFEMKTRKNTTTTKISSNPMLRSLSSILSACVVGNFKQMTKGFSINVESLQEEWIVVMTPQRSKAASRISRIILHFDRQTMTLNLLKMVEKSGDYTMYSFSDKKFNEKIDRQIFNIAK